MDSFANEHQRHQPNEHDRLVEARLKRTANRLAEVCRQLELDRSAREQELLTELHVQYETVDILADYIGKLPIDTKYKPARLHQLLDQAEVRAKQRATARAQMQHQIDSAAKQITDFAGRSCDDVEYHRGMATKYRGELNEALAKVKALERDRDMRLMAQLPAIVDGTGADARAPDQTLARAAALAQLTVFTDDMAHEIADAIEAYHVALIEERDGG